ncbi:unnamed protein product [Dimorphilus gyrociliatus]|uniref:Fork-head domain-containing protein n=1 Tax=Dimorphilus gyrociliatus TaxID=2664684 RepID=A0A7I8VPP9_9ANNE|nr:unnamed protein product [Dimorphilus gyrociliatus]
MFSPISYPYNSVSSYYYGDMYNIQPTELVQEEPLDLSIKKSNSAVELHEEEEIIDVVGEGNDITEEEEDERSDQSFSVSPRSLELSHSPPDIGRSNNSITYSPPTIGNVNNNNYHGKELHNGHHHQHQHSSTLSRRRQLPSYSNVIAEILMSSRDPLPLSAIYKIFVEKQPKFLNVLEPHGLKANVRRELCVNAGFIKVGKAANAKGALWTVHPVARQLFNRGVFSKTLVNRTLNSPYL